MRKVNFYRNGTLVNPPYNHKELEIELNFDKDKDTVERAVSVTDWEWVKENSDKTLEWIEAGRIFEGMPIAIDIEDNGITERVFEGYEDMTEEAEFSCNRSTITSKERKGIDWLNDVADSVTFEYLYKETGEITDDDFVFVPYVINSIPDYQQAALMLISVFVIGEEIRRSLEKLIELAPEMANPLEASAIIRAVLFIAYLTILILSLIELINDLVRLIIQPVKYHSGMRTKDLLRIGAAHFGLTFKSDIFESEPFSKEVIIPPKYRNDPNEEDNRILGFTKPNAGKQPGYYKGTFGDLLRAQKAKHNAKVIITKNNELLLVRQDYNVSQPQYRLPDIYQPFYKTNANELKSNYFIEFQTDLIDKNTIQEYQGTTYQVITRPKSFTNEDLILMKGLESVSIPFALAKRKTDLTVPEKIVDAFLDVFGVLMDGMVKAINAIIQVYNKVVRTINNLVDTLGNFGIRLNFQIEPMPALPPTNLSGLIENRIGMWKIETDFTNTHRVMILNEGSEPKFNKISPDNAVYLSAKYLYENFHYVNSFVPTVDRPNGNQCIIKQFQKVPFCLSDYLKVKNNNIIFDSDNNEAEIVSLKWNPWNLVADMTVRFSQLYTSNLLEVKIEADGK